MRHDGSDLINADQKLQLPEVADAEQIDSENQGDRDQGRDPVSKAGPPIKSAAGDRTRSKIPAFTHANHTHHPTKARRRAQEVGGEVNERLVTRFDQQQLAHRAQHKNTKTQCDPRPP